MGKFIHASQQFAQFLGPWIALLLSLIHSTLGVPAPEPWYGDHLGRLPDFEGIGTIGDVYVVNRTCLQLLNFTYNGDIKDLHFWLDTNENGGLSSGGVKVPTFEYGYSPLGRYNNSKVIILIPTEDKGVTHFSQFGLWSEENQKDFGHVSIRKGLKPPVTGFINEQFRGKLYGNRADERRKRYEVRSGPIIVLDRRTVKIMGFKFDASIEEDVWFVVGKGTPRKSAVVKVRIRGRDTLEFTPLSEQFSGDENLILELPPGHDIYNIDFISVFHYRFGIDFSHVEIKDVSERIPPYVPQQTWFDQAPPRKFRPWDSTTLLGTPGERTNFTFQLGPPGGTRAYMALAKARPSSGSVWYVNGYMTPEIWLLRGITYTFIIEGGEQEDMTNSLYICNDQFGGFKHLTQEEIKDVKIFAGKGSQQYDQLNDYRSPYSGRLCEWYARPGSQEGTDADEYDDFYSFKRHLTLKCNKGQRGLFTWTPDAETPPMLYYQSYEHFNMGWKIMVVDQVPPDIADFEEEPYDYDEFKEYEAHLVMDNGGAGGSCRSGAPLVVTLLVLGCFLPMLSVLFTNDLRHIYSNFQFSDADHR